jgi:hypothetical protein
MPMNNPKVAPAVASRGRVDTVPRLVAAGVVAVMLGSNAYHYQSATRAAAVTKTPASKQDTGTIDGPAAGSR